VRYVKARFVNGYPKRNKTRTKAAMQTELLVRLKLLLELTILRF